MSPARSTPREKAIVPTRCVSASIRMRSAGSAMDAGSRSAAVSATRSIRAA
ncbi:MAG: hypothetical protein U0166_16550 [Acidobacteriota bacterium]